jgi:hypothetical protein
MCKKNILNLDHVNHLCFSRSGWRWSLVRDKHYQQAWQDEEVASTRKLWISLPLFNFLWCLHLTSMYVWRSTHIPVLGEECDFFESMGHRICDIIMYTQYFNNRDHKLEYLKWGKSLVTQILKPHRSVLPVFWTDLPISLESRDYCSYYESLLKIKSWCCRRSGSM